MTESEARAIVQQALRHIDFINLGTVLDSLASGLDWGRYDNSKWRPNFKRVINDKDWLAKNAGELVKALEYFYTNRPRSGVDKSKSEG